MENIPTDYQAGTDFRLNKTQKGGYADYSTSGWARKERGLNETELQAIATHGLFNLNDFMPKRPGIDEQRAIFEMFEASVEGKLYDPEQWGKFYRPSGVQIANAPAGDADEDTPAPKAAPAVSRPAPVATPAPAAQAAAPAPADGAAKPSVDDILKMIRSRSA